MYRVLCDGLPIYDLRDENLVLIDPKLDLEVNKAGLLVLRCHHSTHNMNYHKNAVMHSGISG